MNDWRQDQVWARRFVPEMKRIVGEQLVVEAPYEEDAERNTDLIVLRLDAIRVACRVRRWKYLAQYGNEFTLRSERPNGAKTELTKIIEGWGHYLIYGFADAEERRLASWILGDLSKFRLWFMRRLVSDGGRLPGIERLNSDGSSSLRAFSVDLVDEFLVADRRLQESLL